MKHASLRVIAGPTAYARIRKHGLSPGDISAVFAASGAAKWLTIYGLDRAIFETWLAGQDLPLHLYGTSIGAWKLAAAMEADPGAALERLGKAYIAQTYDKKVVREEVARQARRILEDYLSDAQIQQVMGHPHWQLHIGVSRGKGWLGVDDDWRLFAGLAKAALLNLGGRNALKGMLERVIFSHPAGSFPWFPGDGYVTEQLPLTPTNFRQVLLATASIPKVLPAVRHIEGAVDACYWDGGVLDYHPVPSMMSHFEGLILYPHFYPYLVPGWFDKFLPGRRAKPELMENVVLLAPSEAFVACLPYGRISDRKDFLRFQGNDAERMRVWEICMRESLRMGEAFLQWTESGEIANRVELARMP